MGLRIKKLLGYGFDNMIENDHRIDWDQYEIAIETNIKDFNTYLRLMEDRSDTDLMIYWKMNDRPNDFSYLSEFIHYDTEFGLPNVMLFSNINMMNWSRRDESIDYYESMTSDSPMLNKFKPIPFGIYPYDCGQMTYIQTGQKIASDTLKIFSNVKKPLNMDNGDVIDFNNDIEIRKFAPEIPSLIRHLAVFSGVKPEYVDHMQAGLYEYWS